MLVSVGGTFGVTVGSDAVVGECMIAAGAFDPSGRRWALSAIRPSVSTAPTTKKYFKISIIPPQATPSRLSRARCLRGSFAAVCRYRDGPFSRAKARYGRPFPARARRSALDPTSKGFLGGDFLQVIQGWFDTSDQILTVAGSTFIPFVTAPSRCERASLD